MKHTLKIEDCYYDRIISGEKNFEVRYNDRSYQVGDEIEFTKPSSVYQRVGTWKIKHVHSGLGMADNYVVLGIEEVK